MRLATVVWLMLLVLLVAGLPGLTGLAPRIENEPWGMTTYDFRYTLDVGNFGTAAASNVTVRLALLRDFPPFQTVDSLSIDLAGWTEEVDDLGNRFATYGLPALAPGASTIVNVTARARIFSIDFAITPDSFAYPPVDPRYTAAEPFVESADPRIANVSARLRENSTGDADYAYRAYVWTTHHLTYETQPQERGAVWSLKTGRGMCYEYSNLYMALLRAYGLAVKRVNGWGERFQTGEVHRAEAIAHAWALVYTSDNGWIPVDPTFGDVHLYENYLKINDMHVILTEGVNRHFYRVTYGRAVGTNVQVDYSVHVLSKTEENLSTARAVVFWGMVSVPMLATVVIVGQVARERRKRRILPPSP